MNSLAINDVEILHGHIYCGLGGGAKGFNKGRAQVGSLRARFRCIGGIDVDAAAIRDFDNAAGVPGTVVDLFSPEQFEAFHGRKPPPDWRPAEIADIHRAFNYERPHIVFLSAPCKGFSGLLSETASRTGKYQALNGLTLRGLWLVLEAYKDDPPELIVFENVPRIATRGRFLLDQIVAVLRSYGYAVAETAHDCGEIGNLAQSRRRFLLVARHAEKVPNFLYEPIKHPLRGVGEVLDRLPMPGDPAGGPMHRMPSLQWKTWVRLAFVEAGSDWRSLNKLRVEDGALKDFGIEPDESFYNGAFGVKRWNEPGATVTSKRQPSSGAFSVADPRIEQSAEYGQLGVSPWTRPAPTVTTKMIAGGGRHSVADPRIRDRTPYSHAYRIVRWNEPGQSVTAARGALAAVQDPRPSQREDYKQTKYRVTRFDEAAGTVIAASTTGNGGYAVADPRTEFGEGSHSNKLAVVQRDGASKTITGSDRVGSGALSVADPRPVGLNAKRDAYLTGGHYGVLAWNETARAIAAHPKNNNGFNSVADPRVDHIGDATDMMLPAPTDRLVAVIRALDNTWHRPFTTFELAALQGLVDPEEQLELDGLSDSSWRERIGNAVPPPAAEAIASVMGRALLGAMVGETFRLSLEPIWVRPIAVALGAAR